MKFRNLKIKDLIPNLIVSLAYPLIRIFRVPANRLLAFTDALTIISLILLVLGIINYLHMKGDFDRAQYMFSLRPLWVFSRRAPKPYDEFAKDKAVDHANEFNYPLFLGLIYLVISIFLSYVIL